MRDQAVTAMLDYSSDYLGSAYNDTYDKEIVKMSKIEKESFWWQK
jgi:hypothetical protein